MEKEKNYKVYMHKNKSNGKVYIGQTKNSLKRRWNNGKGYATSPYFCNAIEKYGWDNFEHVLLHDNLSKEEADETEKFYIQKFQSYLQECGYNISLGGSGLTGATKYKDIYKYTLDGDFVKCYKDISDILNENPKYTASPIRCAYDEKIQTAYGYQWKSYFKEKIDSVPDFKDRVAMSKSKAVYKYDLFGNFVCKYNSAAEASRILKIEASGILKTCRYKQKVYANHQWRFEYYNKISSVEIFVYAKYDVNGALLSAYDSLKEASENSNTSKSTIINCCSGRYDLAGGYIWKKYDISQEKIQDRIEVKLDRVKLIELVDDNDNRIKVYNSAKEASIDLGFKDSSGIYNVCNGVYKQTHGYRFRYAS